MNAPRRYTFSLTVISRSKPVPSSSRAQILPVFSIVPEAGVSVPLMAFIIVDLPAPFLPMTPSISPLSRLKDTFLSAQNSLFLGLFPSMRLTMSEVERESCLR